MNINEKKLKNVKIKGDWIDSNGDKNTIEFKSEWGDHVFTEEEIEKLLLGENITFPYKNGFKTGHIQLCVYKDEEKGINRKYYGFCPNDKEEYVLNPVYKSKKKSNFEDDLKKEAIMNEFMKQFYYAKLQNSNRSPVKVDYFLDKTHQDQGIDVVYFLNNKEYIIDEKAQLDFVFREKGPYKTFALELLNSSSGNIGWFINDKLKTEYYMFIWPHAEKEPLTADKIEYAYYALVSKAKLRAEIENKYLDKNHLYEYAQRMASEKFGEEVYDEKTKELKGYRYKGDVFDDHVYLYFTVNKEELPVNLVVRKEIIEKLAEDCGHLKR